MTQPLSADQLARATKITAAFDDAMLRVGTASGPPLPPLGPTDRLFASLGEALAWLCALDELLRVVGTHAYETLRDGDPGGRLVKGLRWARNHSIHGIDVVALAQFHGGAVPGLMVPGGAAPGQPPTFRWRSSAELPALPDPRPHQEASYVSYLAGQPVPATTNAAFNFLRSEAGL